MQGKAKSALNGKSRQKGALSIREMQRATAVVNNQIQDIRTLLKDAKATKKQAASRAMSPLVEQSLQLLTDEVNLSTGLSHPNDLNKAKELLIRLCDAGESLQEVSITAWAREHGWLDKDARYLGNLAAKIASGGQVQVRDGLCSRS